MVTAFDTWKCHICGEERPNGKISVLTKPLIINGQVVPGAGQISDTATIGRPV